MAIHKRHHKEHSFYGEFFGNALAKFLNASKGTEAHRRILLILLELKELSSAGVLRRLPSDSKTRKQIERLNKRLSRYKASPALLPSGGGFRELPSGDSPQERAECIAVRNLIQLAILDLLGSIKLCEYKDHQWFFAKFSHNRFCSKKCRIRWNASSEQAKEYQRKKQREYYHFKKTHPGKGVRR